MSTPEFENIVARLERVRRNGNRGVVARCPAHEDRTASLSVSVGRHGGVLLNCFGGCEVADVVGALGLEFKDLFPPKPENLSPAERAEMQAAADRVKWDAALDTICQEATIVALAARDLAQGREVDRKRLHEAYKLLSRAQAALKVGPQRRRRQQWKPERRK